MRILLTGASSFTGMWFARALAERSHDVVAIFRQDADAYDGLRANRVALVREVCEGAHGVSFGDDAFLELIREGNFHVLCHHAAEASDHRNPDFDVVEALRSNTNRIRKVLEQLGRREKAGIVLTGTFFENDEGVGETPLRAFSAYGLSKGLTAKTVEYYAAVEGISYGKFVVPNPFGPFEEPRFPAYLIRTWRNGETPEVATPAYVRDNIHVSLLAEVYASFVEQMRDVPVHARVSPSGYVETQGAFAQRFASEMAPRLGISCPLELAVQVEYSEPRVRLNTMPARLLAPHWDEHAAWDAVADFYR
jgi:nucleoside-diphosphate-sugar epimerase